MKRKNNTIVGTAWYWKNGKESRTIVIKKIVQSQKGCWMECVVTFTHEDTCPNPYSNDCTINEYAYEWFFDTYKKIHR